MWPLVVFSDVAGCGGTPFERDGGAFDVVDVVGSEVMGGGWEVCSLEMESILLP